MKKVLSIFAIMVFTIGLVSCEAESTADQDNLYIDAPDGDDTGDTGRDGSGTWFYYNIIKPQIVVFGVFLYLVCR